jgi:hypothetical protein
MDRPILSQIAQQFNAQAAANGWPTLCDSSLAFDRPELAAVCDLWFGLAAGGAIPARLDMTPRLLKDYLPYVSFYERIEGGDRRRYRIRLQGSAYQPVMGSLTGKFVDEAVPPVQVPVWEATLDAVIAQNGPLRFLARNALLGKSFLVGEHFTAPLLGIDGTPNCVMGVGYYGGAQWGAVAAAFHRGQTCPISKLV